VPHAEGISLERTLVWAATLGLDVLQVRLPAEFLVEYHARNTRRMAGMIVEMSMMRGQALLCFVLVLVKCTMSRDNLASM
jgi:hypothetical protein